MDFADMEKMVAFEVRTDTKANMPIADWATPIYGELYYLTVSFKEDKITFEDAKKNKEELEKRYNQGENLIAIMSDIGQHMARMENLQLPMKSTLFGEEIKALIDLACALSKLGYKDCAVAIIEDVERKYRERFEG